MISSPSKKMSWLLAVAALLSLVTPALVTDSVFTKSIENDFVKAIKEKLEAFNKHLPEERLYLQLDKPFYEPGDDIWFSGYLREGQLLKASGQSDIVTVELINPKGTIERTFNLVAKNGKVAGDFDLSKEALGGVYKIKAYTNWMKNEGNVNCFEKELQVQDVILPNLKMKLDFERKAFGAGDEVLARLELNTNENKPLVNHHLKYVASINGSKLLEQADATDEEGLKFIRFTLPKELNSSDGLLNVMVDYNGNTESISRSIPIILNKIKLDLYPEGGDLVYGLNSSVAFKAVNEFGKPADVEGIVLTEKGSKIGSFSSYHQGMGAFKISPQQGERYKVKITKPQGIKEEYYLPEPLERGYLLSVDNSKQESIDVELQSTETEELALVAQVRGKMYYSTVTNVLPGSTKISLPTQNMPAGVCQLTVFDSKGIARAERLCFVNREKQLHVSINTEKEKYLPREKVKMTISVKDERGLPMPANLSMAVVNDQLLSFADDKSGNILSQFLLQQDVKDKIEEPAFYFNKQENKSLKALDYLLMTSGWRRFTWEKLIEGNQVPINYPAKKAQFTGTVLDVNTSRGKSNVQILTPSGELLTTNDNGQFTTRNLDLSEPVTLTISAQGYQPQYQQVIDYDQACSVYLYPNNYRTLEEVDIVSQAAMVNENVHIQLAPPAIFAGAADHLEIKRLEGRKSKEQKLAKTNNRRVPKVADPVVAKPLAEPKKVVVNSAVAKFDRDDAFIHDHDHDPAAGAPANNRAHAKYYRARQFANPDYEKQQNTETRTDFRNTIYWNPNIEIGFSGKKTIEFYCSDDITSFRTTIEGMSMDGSIGRAEKNFFTQLPFAMSVKVPVEVATEDVLSIPLTLKNNTNGPLGGLLSITAPEGLKELTKPAEVQTIMPGKAKTIYLDYKVLDKIGTGEFAIAFKSCGLNDAFTQSIKIVPKGFPVQASFSGQDIEKEFEFNLNNLVNGSLRINFNAFPNVVTDLVKGVEGILSEPYGCFEQTSCTAYPNAMVLDYLKNTGSKDSKTLARATDLLDRGYKRLTTFETSNKGYEWFGANPAHEGLTAYGIMEFVDMKRAGQEIDEQMLDRTARWLLSHKDGKGNFEREQRANHDFGRISNDILNAYIVYALAEAGYTDIRMEFDNHYNKAMSIKDPYMLAMMANAAYSLKLNNKGDEAMKILLKSQAKDGSFNGTSHSITYSQGSSLSIETTALSIMAMLKSSNKYLNEMNKAVNFLVGTRSGSGVFSSTQGTILALKCLTEFAKFNKKASEDGTIAIYIDNKKVAEKNYKAGDKGAIVIDELEKFVKEEGNHKIKVKYIGVKNPLPYSVSVNWNTSLPVSQQECSIDLKTQLSANEAKVGETVRLTVTLTNKNATEVPSTMAIIGIPAGFSAQPWQLKELQEKNVFDYYEIKGNNIAIYYRGMAAAAVKVIHLDLKAELPGEYDAPASTAYLYYTNEYKSWSALNKVIIKKNAI